MADFDVDVVFGDPIAEANFLLLRSIGLQFHLLRFDFLFSGSVYANQLAEWRIHRRIHFHKIAVLEKEEM